MVYFELVHVDEFINSKASKKLSNKLKAAETDQSNPMDEFPYSVPSNPIT